MENRGQSLVGKLCGISISYMRRFLFDVLSVGPIPNHIAFILDGNRRYARKYKLGEGMGHRAGFLSLMSLMKYCYELGIKYITIYAFSIDNFRRKPHEVKYVMDLMLEKIEGMLKEESFVDQYGVRVYFIGNLNLLNDTVRNAAEKAMKATEKNNRAILLICVAYTSTDEIVHAAQESGEQLLEEIETMKPKGPQFNKIREIIEEKEEKLEEKNKGETNGQKQEKDGEEKQWVIIKKKDQQNASEEKQEEVSKNGQEQEKHSEEKQVATIKKEDQQNASEEKQEEEVNNDGQEHEKDSEEKQGVIFKKEYKQNPSEEKQEEEVSKEKVEEKTEEKLLEIFGKEMKEVQAIIRLSDIEKNMYMGLAPDVDILVRTSGETRLSNFLLWQTWNGLLYSPKALWPEIGLKHLVWSILNFQKAHPLFEKRKKQF